MIKSASSSSSSTITTRDYRIAAVTKQKQLQRLQVRRDVQQLTLQPPAPTPSPLLPPITEEADEGAKFLLHTIVAQLDVTKMEMYETGEVAIFLEHKAVDATDRPYNATVTISSMLTPEELAAGGVEHKTLEFNK